MVKIVATNLLFEELERCGQNSYSRTLRFNLNSLLVMGERLYTQPAKNHNNKHSCYKGTLTTKPFLSSFPTALIIVVIIFRNSHDDVIITIVFISGCFYYGYKKFNSTTKK
jgi:hypothetical protein